MRNPALLVLALVVGSGAGCRIFSAALPCGDDSGCPAGEVCVDGTCAAAPGEGEGEGEGDATAEGEGDEGEGDGVEGEGDGDEGEGDGVVGEGEGDGVVGEGEGDGVIIGGEGEGEGEGVVIGGEGEGEGEGEGDGPVDPCPPLLVEEFDGVANFEQLLEQGPSSSVSLGTGQLRLNTAAVADGQAGSFAVVSTSAFNFVGDVIELDLQLQQNVLGGESVGLSFAADNFPTDFDLNLDVVGNNLAFYAMGTGPGPIQTIERGFPGGTLTVQIRLDGATPVAVVNGLSANLTNVTSATIRNHHLDLFAGCFDPSQGCNGVTLTVERVRIFGSCRP